ncbi:MAG TPA: glycosyltransferase family 2 protein [Tepidisphaeraceae bacterium]|nr:glycosyltransferase family 2 protein [Tepidisphaeraceae bacterium]
MPARDKQHLPIYVAVDGSPGAASPALSASRRSISAVIPLMDEVESLAQLYRELDDVARAENYDLEVIFVDDGSTDGSWRLIEQIAAGDPRVRGIRFRRNFGKAAALSAGFDAATHDVVFTLDADLQDDPREIPRFLAEMDKGIEVISGWKRVRHDPIHKVWPSRIFNALVSRLTGVHLHDHNCGFKCYRREIFSEVQLYGELHRFVPVLAAARGWSVGEIEINHRPRTAGRSKYGVRRFVKGFLDLLTVYFLTGFGQRPLHLLGTLGLICFLLGAAGMTYLGIYWVLRMLIGGPDWIPLHQRPAVLYSLGALLLGAQLLSIGFLAELITANSRRNVVPYSVAAQTPAINGSSRERAGAAGAVVSDTAAPAARDRDQEPADARPA